MSTSPFAYGFRCHGKAGERRLIDWSLAFRAHAELDPRSEPERESFLSHFHFGLELPEHFATEGSERGYNGPCGASWLFWDLDRPNDLPAALSDSRRLVGVLLDRYRELDEDDLLVFLSGGKGCHVGLPLVWCPEPSPTFNLIARHFAEARARQAEVVIDSTLYSKTRLLRSPNSKHPATGLHKRLLTVEELLFLTPSAIVERAGEPEYFEVPTGPSCCSQAADDWRAAERAVGERAVERKAFAGRDRLSGFARRFIRDGELDAAQRQVSTFRVAAELSELYHAHGLETLVRAIVEEAALDSGLPPAEVRRAVETGVAHAQRRAEGGAA